MKYYKRLNRYTLFQITLVYVPTMAASVYNLFYTWYGRQVFWIDIEALAIGLTMICLHVKVILRTQGEYIKRFDEIRAMEKAKAMQAYYAKYGYTPDGPGGKVREKYLIDPMAQEMADEIAMDGFDK